MLGSLSPAKMEELADRQNLAPTHSEPWIKVLTAGSDDHGGMYPAKAWNELPHSGSIKDLLEHIRAGHITIHGCGGTPLAISHGVYKILYSFIREKFAGRSVESSDLIEKVFDRFMEGRDPTVFTAGEKFAFLAQGIASGKIKTLIVFGENIVKRAVANEKLRERETISEVVDEHGITAELLAKLDTLIVSDILPNETTKLAHYVLPGAAHAEKRGSFTNGKGRVQKFMKAVEAPGDARAEWEFLHDLVHNVTGQNGFVTIEGLFNQMAKEVSAFNGLTWSALGDTGVTVQI